MMSLWKISRCQSPSCPYSGEWMTLKEGTWHNAARTKHFATRDAARSYLRSLSERGGGNAGPVPIIDDTTGQVYRSMMNAAARTGVSYSALQTAVKTGKPGPDGRHYTRLIPEESE